MYLEMGNTPGDFFTPCDDLCGWLDAFEEWYERVCADSHAFLRMGRGLCVSCTDVKECADAVGRLLSHASDVGYSTTLMICLEELCECFDMVEDFANKSVLNGVSITILGDEDGMYADHVEHMMGRLNEHGVQLTFSGPLDSMWALKLFSSDVLNGYGCTLSPYEPEACEIVPAPPNPVKPCAERMGLFIAPDGMIYPCKGLIGFEEYAIGSIEKGGPDVKKSPIDLVRIMVHGPDAEVAGDTDPEVSQPWMCRRHRVELSRLSDVRMRWYDGLFPMGHYPEFVFVISMNCTPSRANPDSLENVELLETGIQPVVFYIMNIDEGFFINDAIGSDLLRAFTSVPGISKIERVSPTKCQSLKRTCRLL